MRVGDSTLRDGKLSTTTERRTNRTDDTENERIDPARRAEEGPSPFARILQGLGREVDRGENLVHRAIRGSNGGQELGNLELLSLQAGVYRYSEAVDLSAKLVDRASSGVKTVLQGQ
jgi:hypothetical protein